MANYTEPGSVYIYNKEKTSEQQSKSHVDRNNTLKAYDKWFKWINICRILRLLHFLITGADPLLFSIILCMCSFLSFHVSERRHVCGAWSVRMPSQRYWHYLRRSSVRPAMWERCYVQFRQQMSLRTGHLWNQMRKEVSNYYIQLTFYSLS
jgi:hypothetical protein